MAPRLRRQPRFRTRSLEDQVSFAEQEVMKTQKIQAQIGQHLLQPSLDPCGFGLFPGGWLHPSGIFPEMWSACFVP